MQSFSAIQFTITEAASSKKGQGCNLCYMHLSVHSLKSAYSLYSLQSGEPDGTLQTPWLESTEECDVQQNPVQLMLLLL